MERLIALNGAKNFRDFGGYATRDGTLVRRGLLYRSDSLASLDETDIRTVASLGIRTVCDLRRVPERERSPSRWHDTTETRHLHLPLLCETSSGGTGSILADARLGNRTEASRNIMLAVYERMASDQQALVQLGCILRLIADQALPLLVHCSGGKDRTGVCCALILALLDVDDATIMDDYLASQVLYSQPMLAARNKTSQVVDMGQQAVPDDVLVPIYSVDRAYLERFFEVIEQHHGSVFDFAIDALGLERTEIDRIRRNLIDALPAY